MFFVILSTPFTIFHPEARRSFRVVVASSRRTHPFLSVHLVQCPAAYSMPLSASESDSYAQHNPADQPLRMSRYAHRRY